MASFTETATLKVQDDASRQIKEINKALKALSKTASAFGSKKFNFDVTAKGATAADAAIKKLIADVEKLKGVGAVRISANTSGLSQASRQLDQLRNKAARPITTFIRGAVAGAGAYATHAAGHAVVEGARTTDIGETSLALKQLTAEHRKFVDEQISDISKQQAARPGGAMFARGAIAQQVSEMLGTVNIGAATSEEDFKARASQAKFMADQNLELAGTLVKLGKSAEEATADSIKFGKAIDLSGQIYDKTTGKIDPEKATAAYDQIRQLIPAIGAEMSGSNFLQMMKYLRSSKFALAPEAMALAMRNFEEMGTGAAVGLNQMIKNLSRSAKPAQLEEQRRLGLTETRLVPKGRVGHKVMKEVAGDMLEADQKLLREHPQQFVDTKLVPALIKDLTSKGLTREQAEAKTFDPAYVATQMGKIFSDRTAQEMATLMVLQRNENAQFLKDWASRSGDMTVQRAATQYSVIGATTAIGQQLQSVFGELTRAAAPALVPTLGVASEGLREFANTVAEASQGNVAAQEKLKTATALGIAASPFAKMGIDVAKGVLGPVGAAIDAVARPLGQVSALQAMGSANEGVRALGASAQAQLSAADAMNAMTQANLLDKGKGALDQLAKSGGPLGNLAFLLLQLDRLPKPELKPVTEEDRTGAVAAERKKLVDQAIKADSQVQDAQKNLANASEALAKARKAGLKSEIARLTQVESQFKALLAERQAAFDRANRAAQAPAPAEQRRMLPPMEVKPPRPFLEDFEQKVVHPLVAVIRAKGAPQVGKVKPEMQVPMPMADPRKAGVPAVPENTLNLLTTANQNFANSATSLLTGAGELKSVFDTGPRMFEQVFNTLPQKVSEGGDAAGSRIQSAMAAGGEAAGSIIAGKIAAAAANIQVTVNTTVKEKADTGAQKATMSA